MFKYYMNERPLGIGCQPKGFVSFDEDDAGGRYGSILYDRELTEQEVKDYELTKADFVGDTFHEIWKEIQADPSKRALINDDEAMYEVHEMCPECGREASGLVDIREKQVRVKCEHCGRDCIACTMCDDHFKCNECLW